MKKLAIALLLVALIPAVASAQIISKDNFSVVGALGVAVAVNSTAFQSDFDEGLTYSLRAEYRIHPRVSVYGDYASVSFDPVAASQDSTIEVSSAAVGVIFFGALNQSQSVLAFLDVGASSNTVEGQDTEWKVRPGGGFDVAVTPQVGIRPAVYVNRYAGDPQFVDGLEFKLWLRLTPFADVLFF